MDNFIDIDLFQSVNNNHDLKNITKNIILQRFLLLKVYHLLWHIFHSFSVLYPDTPTEEQKTDIKTFLLSLKKDLRLFCSTCGGNTKDIFIETSDIDSAVSSRDNLIQFFCDYHISVNTISRPNHELYNYNPQLYNKDFIINRYTTNDYIGFIENTYNINLFKLFNNRQLPTFFQIFKDIFKKILSEKQYDFYLNFYKISN